jgi:hypothetical protein
VTAASKRLARLIGLLVGCGIAVAVVVSGRVAESGGTLGARLAMEAKPVDELVVSPSGPQHFLRGHLTPGADGARGRVRVRNLGERELSVRVRAAMSSSDLDGKAWVEVRAGRERVFRGRLGTLRRWSTRDFSLGKRRQQELQVRAWLPSSARDGYEARSVDVALEWDPRGEAG